MSIQLGCGLIRIGRTWGFKNNTIPTDEDVQSFLHEAVKLGIRFFDTAPAYGLSEERLGEFLKSLPASIRNALSIATKCGEVWKPEIQSTIVDHSYDALVHSIDTSLSLLGKVDILQIHKATPQVLQSEDVKKALIYAKSCGIQKLGASISDKETAQIVSTMDELSIIQFPFNQERTEMKEAIQLLKGKGKIIIINRPLNMGGLVYTPKHEKTKQQLLAEAYEFILKENFEGVILTGTGNENHLQENLSAFKHAITQLDVKNK